jgi:hypothetical protein
MHSDKGRRAIGTPMSLRWAAIAVPLAMLSRALAFDDKQFCVATQQLAIAAEKDIGIWIDRVTRNAGIVVPCDRKLVEFTRFTYATSASMLGRNDLCPCGSGRRFQTMLFDVWPL